MTKTRKPQRSPDEIIAEKEAQILKLRSRAALTVAKTSPEVACVAEALDQIVGYQRESSKLLGNSPQGCAARRMKHTLWINEINAMEALAQVGADAQDTAKQALSLLLEKATSALVNDLPLDVDELAIETASILRDYENSDEVAAALQALEDAKTARAAFANSDSTENSAENSAEASA